MKYNTRIVLAYFDECGLPPAQVEYNFCVGRKWRFDFAWPRWLVALEVEGGIFTRGAHSSVQGILRDIEKYNAAAAYGWRVLRVVPENLCMQDTVNLILRTMGLTLGKGASPKSSEGAASATTEQAKCRSDRSPG